MDESVNADSDGKKAPKKQVMRLSEKKKNLKIKNTTFSSVAETSIYFLQTTPYYIIGQAINRSYLIENFRSHTG